MDSALVATKRRWSGATARSVIRRTVSAVTGCSVTSMERLPVGSEDQKAGCLHGDEPLQGTARPASGRPPLGVQQEEVAERGVHVVQAEVRDHLVDVRVVLH